MGREEDAKGNSGIADLYYASAALGITSAVMLGFFAFNPFTLLVVIAFCIVAYYLETRKDNAVQSWLGNCIFGKVGPTTYDLTPDREMRDYQLATS